MEKNLELIQQPNSNTPSEEQKETIKLDIFQHIKLGFNNKDKNCQCENTPENLYYCIPCKASCCQKCSLPEHSNHLLIKKDKYSLKPSKINNSFNSIETILSKDELFQNIQQKKKRVN